MCRAGVGDVSLEGSKRKQETEPEEAERLGGSRLLKGLGLGCSPFFPKVVLK